MPHGNRPARQRSQHAQPGPQTIAATTGVMQGRQEGNQADGNNANALKNAQRARLQLQNILRIQGKAHGGGTASRHQKEPLAAR